MLSASARLTRSADFTAVVRTGRRAGRPLLTVHLLTDTDTDTDTAVAGSVGRPPRAGLVVSRAVGGSVVRHRTARRLRHLLRDRLPQLPAGSRLVVRAAPGAGSADSARLGRQLDAALAKATR